jgi:hypothetical protein
MCSTWNIFKFRLTAVGVGSQVSQKRRDLDWIRARGTPDFEVKKEDVFHVEHIATFLRAIFLRAIFHLIRPRSARIGMRARP